MQGIAIADGDAVLALNLECTLPIRRVVIDPEAADIGGVNV